MVFVGATLPSSPALRLAMVAERAHHGVLHGSWWPRGRDLAAELPALVAGLDAWLDASAPGRGEHVTRLSMRLSGWDAVPARVDLAGLRVRMAWSGGVDAHGLGVTSSTGDHFDLLIIPPRAPAKLAGTAAGLAIDPSNTLDQTAILARAMPGFVPGTPPDRLRVVTGSVQAAARSGPTRLVDDGEPHDTAPIDAERPDEDPTS